MKTELDALLWAGLLPALVAASLRVALSWLMSETAQHKDGEVSLLPPVHFWERAGVWDRWREMERAGTDPTCPSCVFLSSPHTPSPLLGISGTITAHQLSAKFRDCVHFPEIHKKQLCHHFFCPVTEHHSVPKATVASPSAPRGSLCQNSSFASGCVKGIDAIFPFLRSSFPYCISQTSRLSLQLASHPASPPSQGWALRCGRAPPGGAAGPAMRRIRAPLPPPTPGIGTNFVSSEDTVPSVPGRTCAQCGAAPCWWVGEAPGALCLVGVCWTRLLFGLCAVKEKKAFQNHSTASALRIRIKKRLREE